MDDGRSFEPVPWETAVRRDPRPVFTDLDRDRLSADPHLRPYLSVTQEQVAGILAAFGEYAGRILPGHGTDVPPGVEADADTLRAHEALLAAYGEVMRDPRDPAPPPSADTVFDAAERRELAHRKWVRGSEHITREDLGRLLRALDQYATRAPQVPVSPGVNGSPLAVVLINRFLHAHNSLIRFRERPFTLHEFAESVRDVIDRAIALRGPRSSR